MAQENLTVIPTALPDVLIITPVRHGDARGFFSETYNKHALAAHGIVIDFVQDNHAKSGHEGTVRGLHFQTPPFAQDKLVRVVRGAILDVVVDIRAGSPTFGHHVGVEISAAMGNQILVPKGFAHGLVTLERETEVLYKVSAPYSPDHDKGLAWDDPDLNIDWGVEPDNAILSDKDRHHPNLHALPAYFRFGEEAAW